MKGISEELIIMRFSARFSLAKVFIFSLVVVGMWAMPAIGQDPASCKVISILTPDQKSERIDYGVEKLRNCLENFLPPAIKDLLLFLLRIPSAAISPSNISHSFSFLALMTAAISS